MRCLSGNRLVTSSFIATGDNIEAGEILVSRTVKDLVAGTGLHFKERGKHSLKGLQEAMELYAVSH